MKFEKKIFIKYIIFVFVIAWILQISASFMLYKGNGLAYTGLLSISMFAPMAALLLSGGKLKALGWKPRFKANIKYILLAWFMPAVVTALGGALYYALMPNRLDLSGGYIAAQYGEQMMQSLQQSGITPAVFMLISVAQAVSYAPVVNMLFALGEEAGWRGFMYPMLKDKFGTTQGRIIGGIIWGAWHWPVMILAGYEYGRGYFGEPFLGMALFCVCTVFMGILLDWLYEKSDCIWLPSLAHGAFNAVAVLPMLVLDVRYLNQLTLGPASIGAISMIPMAILAIVASINTTKSKEKIK